MATQQVPFHIKSGLPFAKTVTVTLPNGRAWWTSDSQFEVLCQIREAADVDSPLVLDLAQFLTVSLAGDVVTIELVMNGADTRLVTKDGDYDMLISDDFAVDARGYSLIEGPVHRTTTITAGTEETDV